MLKKGPGMDFEKKTLSIEAKKRKYKNRDKITQEKLLLFVVSTHVLIHRHIPCINFIRHYRNIF